jgi:hypothetical protein
MFLEITHNISPGGWSHHENPLKRALYVPEGPQDSATASATEHAARADEAE